MNDERRAQRREDAGNPPLEAPMPQGAMPPYNELVELLKKTDRIIALNRKWLYWNGFEWLVIRDPYRNTGGVRVLYGGDSLIEALKVSVGEK